MSHASGLISAPVSINDDVHTVLNDSSYDLGTLCKSDSVNMWSKYKPVKYPGDFASSDDKHPYWWQANDGMCGIEPQTAASLAALARKYNGGTANWTRVAPVGGVDSPYRLLDFDGYYHNATPPIKSFHVNAEQLLRTDTLIGTILYYTDETSDGRSIMLKDMVGMSGFGVKDRYFGIAVYSKDKYYWATATQTIEDGGYTASIPCSNFTDGDHTAMGFLTKSSSEGGVMTDTPTSILTLPLSYTQSFSIVSNYITVTVLAGRFMPPAGDYTVTFTVKNTNANTGYTFSNNQWQVRYSDKDYKDSITNGEYSGTFGDISIAANTTATYTATVHFTSQMAAQSTCKIYILLQGQAYVGVGTFREAALNEVS